MNEIEGKGKLRKIIILLVDDDQADINITLRAFKKLQTKDEIFVVKDGQEAIDFIFNLGKFEDKKKFPMPDLILLDLKLPKLSGFQVLEKLKNDSRCKHIPIIILTSSKNEDDIRKCYELGCSSYIPKTISYENFVEIIKGFNYYWHEINLLPSKE